MRGRLSNGLWRVEFCFNLLRTRNARRSRCLAIRLNFFTYTPRYLLGLTAWVAPRARAARLTWP